jgi:hypothetical protein
VKRAAIRAFWALWNAQTKMEDSGTQFVAMIRSIASVAGAQQRAVCVRAMSGRPWRGSLPWVRSGTGFPMIRLLCLYGVFGVCRVWDIIDQPIDWTIMSGHA